MSGAGIAWDYEETANPYYHIFVNGGSLDGEMDAIRIAIPRTRENDNDIQIIVQALQRIELRVSERREVGDEKN